MPHPNVRLARSTACTARVAVPAPNRSEVRQYPERERLLVGLGRRIALAKESNGVPRAQEEQSAVSPPRAAISGCPIT